jgi:hypothetical protein
VHSTSPRSPTRQRRPAQTREVRGSNPREETARRSMRRRPIGRTPGCYPGDVGSTPTVAAQSQLVPRSSNGRIFGSEPKDAWFESRPRSSYGRGHGGQAGSNPAQERVRFLPSVLRRPGLLVDRGCRPLKPATRVRIPLGALCNDAAVVSTAACGRAMPAVRVRAPPAALHAWGPGSNREHTRLAPARTGFESPGLHFPLAVAQRTKSATPRRWKTEVRFLPASLSNDDGRARDRTGLIRRH